MWGYPVLFFFDSTLLRTRSREISTVLCTLNLFGGEGPAPYTGQYPTLHARSFPMTREKYIISLGGLGVVSCLFSMSSLHYDDDDRSGSGQTMAFDRVYIYTYIL